MPTCFLLTLSELDDMISAGYSVVSGGFATEGECLAVCGGSSSSSGSVLDGCGTSCVQEGSIQLTCLNMYGDGMSLCSDCPNANGVWTLSSFELCAWRSSEFVICLENYHWVVRLLSPGSWYLGLERVLDNASLISFFGSGTFPVTLTKGAFTGCDSTSPYPILECIGG